MPLAQLGLGWSPLAIWLVLAWLGLTVGSLLAALAAVALGALALARGRSGRWARRLGLSAAAFNAALLALCVGTTGHESPPGFVEAPAVTIAVIGLLGAGLGMVALAREGATPGRLRTATGWVVLILLAGATLGGTEREAYVRRKREALMIAAGSDDAEAVQRALAEGVSAAERDALLAGACHSWRGATPRVVAVLLAAGANVNATNDQDARDGPAWRSAVAKGDPATVDLFLAHGADPSAAWPDGTTPAEIAWYQGNAELLARLRRAGALDADSHERDFQALAEAARAGDLERFRALRTRGVPDWHPGDSGDAVFKAAGEGGHVEVLRLLTATKLYKCAAAEQALSAASRSGNQDAVAFLRTTCAVAQPAPR